MKRKTGKINNNMDTLSKNKRPDWDTYFLRLAHVVKERANCLRMSVGVVVVKDKHIVATGYNGTPAGIPNCFDGGCERCTKRQKNELGEGENKDTCICIHAEQNAILQSAFHGVSTHGAHFYTTLSPCLQCAKAMINAGIAKLTYEDDYKSDEGLKLLTAAGIEVTKATTT